MRIDYHMHTPLTDGTGEPREYVRVALERGLAEIGFSDHAPLADRDTDWTMKKTDLPRYIASIEAVQREFPQLPVRIGLEVDWIPGCEAWVHELAATYRWDYFLGSVHYLGDGFPVDRSAEDWRGQDVEARWREYFALWEQAASSGLFDSLAHPDLPKKFGFRPAGELAALYSKALQKAAVSGVAIEISTAGLRKPCREIYPSEEFLRIARMYDVPATLGSDAHIPDDVGNDFDKGVALARRCGYEQVCRFKARRCELVRLT